MYSLVLMTAMTATPNAPEFNGYFRDLFSGRGCAGCYGSTAPRYSGYGGCGGSFYPAGCSGSFYNGCNGCNGDTFLNRVRRWFDRGDCCGGAGSGYGCVGSVGYSCSGSMAYSCFGSPPVSYTPVFNGGQSCFGGPIPSAPAPMFDQFPAFPGAAPLPSIPYAPPEAAPGMNPANVGLKPAAHTESALVSNAGSAGARATVIVKLPADARLFADARPLALTGAERKFVTPELPSGPEFNHRLRIEYEPAGEPLSVTKQVPVRGGTVTIVFTDLTAKTAPQKNAEMNPSGVAATPTSNSVTKPEPPIAPAVTQSAPVPAPSSPATDRATIT